MYKFFMGQFIWERHPNHMVRLTVRNRTPGIKLTNIISEENLREQLDYTKNLKFTKKELLWLTGNTFYGQERIFKKGYIDFLRTLKLPDYEITIDENGEYVISFYGKWAEVTYWEIYALEIISELKTRHYLKDLSKLELDILYSSAKTKLWNNLNLIKNAGVRGIADMGSRRRHSFLHQRWAIEAAASVLGDGFVGTSNAYIAMEDDYEAIGTNAHELPMTLTAIRSGQGASDDEIRRAQHDLLLSWQNQYSGNMLVALPDTFGTTQFLSDAPEYLSNWRGFRPDSKDPYAGADELINWWNNRAVDPKNKMVLFSDGLSAQSIVDLWETYRDKVIPAFGWGTNLTNDFRDCNPQFNDNFNPISLVCKVTSVDGHPAVKLSDNYAKATGDPAEVEKYRRIFGSAGMTNIPLEV
jgi:nicotinate phosphoribosyltransferase